jgi:hypothetical protein
LTVILAAISTAIALVVHRRPIPRELVAPTAGQAVSGLRLEVPNATWEPIFFKALRQRTKQIHLQDLRTVDLPDRDLEMRFWYWTTSIINGFVIKRSGSQWSAIGIRQMNEDEPAVVEQKVLPTPKSGWERAWERLVSEGLLELPDGSDIKCHTVVLDGGSLVVETNVNRVYRTYMYANPDLAKCDGAKQIRRIEEIIAEEFALNRDDSRARNSGSHTRRTGSQ